MEDLIRFVIPGLPLGCIYALVATGLVLTYKTSGVFNLAFGAQAYVSAAIFYELVKTRGWPLWAGFLVAVVVVAPILGLFLDRGIFRHMRNSPMVIRLVVALGLMVVLPAVVQLWFGQAHKFGPPSLAPDPEGIYRFGTYAINADQVMAVVVTLVLVALLGALFRFSPLGLRMRAVVESPRMVQLAGIDADRVSSTAWIMSSFMAGLAGVLLAPLFGVVDSDTYTFLIVAAIAAAAFGKLTSIPLTLAGGVVLGVAQQLLGGYLPLDSALVAGLRPSVPFIMLFLLLLFLPGLRRGRDFMDPLAGVDPPPPALAATYREPALERINRVAFPVFLVAFMAVALFVLPSYWLFVITLGIVYATIFLSITIITGMSGMLSLAQATFAGVGAFTVAQLALRWDVPVLGGLLIGAGVAAVIGMVVAVPALRLGGLFLALATLAFALMADNLLFPLDWIGRGETGVSVPRPAVGGVDFTANRSMFLLVMAFFAVTAYATIFVRRGTVGRYLAAMRGSEVAASAIGINPVRAKVTVFALSAAVAGLGGGLLASLQGRVSTVDFATFQGLFWVVIVLILGARTVEGAVNAGMAMALFPEILSMLGVPLALKFVGFGLAALTFAKHPEGIVESSKRKIHQRVAARRGSRTLPEREIRDPVPAEDSTDERVPTTRDGGES